MTAQTRENFLLWTGVLLPPIAWLLQVQTNYAIARFLCGNARLAPISHVVTFITVAAAISAAIIAFNRFRRDDTEARQQFMAAIGVMLAPLFALLILAQWSARFFVDPCVY